MRRKIFRVNFLLNICSISFIWSHSKSTEWYSAFYWGSGWWSFDDFRHVLSYLFFNINDWFNTLCFDFEKSNESLYFKIMLMHLKEL